MFQFHSQGDRRGPQCDAGAADMFLGFIEQGENAFRMTDPMAPTWHCCQGKAFDIRVLCVGRERRGQQ